MLFNKYVNCIFLSSFQSRKSLWAKYKGYQSTNKHRVASVAASLGQLVLFRPTFVRCRSIFHISPIRTHGFRPSMQHCIEFLYDLRIQIIIEQSWWCWRSGTSFGGGAGRAICPLWFWKVGIFCVFAYKMLYFSYFAPPRKSVKILPPWKKLKWRPCWRFIFFNEDKLSATMILLADYSWWWYSQTKVGLLGNNSVKIPAVSQPGSRGPHFGPLTWSRTSVLWEDCQMQILNVVTGFR